MFRPVRRRTVEWRRVAQFEPVRVEGAPIAQEEATERPNRDMAAEAGVRVLLRREPENERDRHSVAVDTLDERTLGYLPDDVAAWVAPLLDSGHVNFDGRIYAIDPAAPASNAASRSFYVSLTQFELLPVKRSWLAASLAAVARLPLWGVKRCVGAAAALYQTFNPNQAFSRTTPRFDGPPADRYAADDHSGGRTV